MTIMTFTGTREEAIKLWTEALRSGKYKQGRNALHNISENSWCCLGVLCDVLGVSTSGDTITGYTIYGDVDDGSTADLPDLVADFMGMTAAGVFDKQTAGQFQARSLIGLNDTKRWDFIQIADFIESNPAGLFGGNEE